MLIHYQFKHFIAKLVINFLIIEFSLLTILFCNVVSTVKTKSHRKSIEEFNI